MTVANGQTMANKTIFTCPACKKVVSARVLIEFEFNEVEESKLRGNGTLVGLEVSHNCIPKLSRGIEKN